jgi:hypothetical protein
MIEQQKKPEPKSQNLMENVDMIKAIFGRYNAHDNAATVAVAAAAV